MLLQTNSYIVPKERRAEHARLLRRFRQVLLRLGCEQFEVYEQMGNNWSGGEATGRFVQIMRFRDRKHQRQIHAAEQTDPAAQQLISDFCDLINLPYQQQQGLLAVGYYQAVADVAGVRTKAVEEDVFEGAAPGGFGEGISTGRNSVAPAGATGFAPNRQPEPTAKAAAKGEKREPTIPPVKRTPPPAQAARPSSTGAPVARTGIAAERAPQSPPSSGRGEDGATGPVGPAAPIGASLVAAASGAAMPLAEVPGGGLPDPASDELVLADSLPADEVALPERLANEDLPPLQEDPAAEQSSVSDDVFPLDDSFLPEESSSRQEESLPQDEWSTQDEPLSMDESVVFPGEAAVEDVERAAGLASGQSEAATQQVLSGQAPASGQDALQPPEGERTANSDDADLLDLLSTPLHDFTEDSAEAASWSGAAGEQGVPDVAPQRTPSDVTAEGHPLSEAPGSETDHGESLDFFESPELSSDDAFNSEGSSTEPSSSEAPTDELAGPTEAIAESPVVLDGSATDASGVVLDDSSTLPNSLGDWLSRDPRSATFPADDTAQDATADPATGNPVGADSAQAEATDTDSVATEDTSDSLDSFLEGLTADEPAESGWPPDANVAAGTTGPTSLEAGGTEQDLDALSLDDLFEPSEPREQPADTLSAAASEDAAEPGDIADPLTDEAKSAVPLGIEQEAEIEFRQGEIIPPADSEQAEATAGDGDQAIADAASESAWSAPAEPWVGLHGMPTHLRADEAEIEILYERDPLDGNALDGNTEGFTEAPMPTINSVGVSPAAAGDADEIEAALNEALKD